MSDPSIVPLTHRFSPARYGLGFIGNLFALIIFSSLLEFRRISTGVLFLLTTISNFFHLWALTTEFIGICGYEFDSHGFFYCRFTPFVENVTRAMSTYFAVGIAIDRFIRSELPIRAKLICTRRNIIVLTAVSFVVFGAFWSFYLMPFGDETTESGLCVYEGASHYQFFAANIHVPLRAVLFCLLPIVLMVAANLRTMSNIHQARARIGDIPAMFDAAKSSTIISSTAISGPVGRRTLAIDRMLFLMMSANVLTFVVTQLPFHIYMVLKTARQPADAEVHALIFALLSIWSGVYFGIAFYLYCLASPLFRRKLVRISRRACSCQRPMR